jgi:hypothetical protein
MSKIVLQYLDLLDMQRESAFSALECLAVARRVVPSRERNELVDYAVEV